LVTSAPNWRPVGGGWSCFLSRLVYSFAGLFLVHDNFVWLLFSFLFSFGSEIVDKHGDVAKMFTLQLDEIAI
jgi:hypothetical protein